MDRMASADLMVRNHPANLPSCYLVILSSCYLVILSSCLPSPVLRTETIPNADSVRESSPLPCPTQ